MYKIRNWFLDAPWPIGAVIFLTPFVLLGLGIGVGLDIGCAL